ncbi:site-specific integrase [Dactylosporangium fulvum]|uniref:Site-specific integrase n=1 Tax=Dactylosporangium fulvum TaxID=53359 RepID=A0ABY5VVM2_9ACTN|nr:site-specific integrase [Dactylosporangium fulvum]UWP80533.1 site-specific integrase [Dactylosporangium fulvum]
MGRPRKAAPSTGKVKEELSVWHGKEGWQGSLLVGTKPNGKPDRRHRRGKTEAEVRAKLAKLADEMQAGRTVKAGVPPKLSTLLTEWMSAHEEEWSYKTFHNSYGPAVHNWLIPGIGEWRVNLLLEQPKAIERFLKGIRRDPEAGERAPGLNPGGVHLVFRTLRAALNWAVKEKIIPRSPIELMTWRPKLVSEEVTPLLVSEVKAILDVCERRRNGTRWSIAMPLGLRQGEALGLPWMKPSKSTKDKPVGLDLAGGWMVVRRQAGSRQWEHGCEDPVACAARFCRTRPCPVRWQHGCGKKPEDCTKQRVDRCPQRMPSDDCARHRKKKTCKEVCQPGCTKHGHRCPKRVGGGVVFTDPKSEAGKRRIALDRRMRVQFEAHKQVQDLEREAAGDAWVEFGLVWCHPDGSPIDAKSDWLEWKEILREAGVRDARVHDGRHTAATMLLLQGIDEQTVMAVMGWSDRRMVQRYQHVIDELRVEATRRLSDLLYGSDGSAQGAAPPAAPVPTPVPAPNPADQQKEADADGVSEGFATDLATSATSAKIIPFDPSRKKHGKRHLSSVNGNTG